MTLRYELDLYMIKTNHQISRSKSCHPKIIVRTCRHTHTHSRPTALPGPHSTVWR